jgi:uncharacterized phage-associated protein
MEYDGRAVANFVLDACSGQRIAVSNLALQKLVYFCHVWTLIEHGRPLIKQRFEAWEYGPVLPYLYREFKAYDRSPITGRATKIDPANGDQVTRKHSRRVAVDTSALRRYFAGLRSGSRPQILSCWQGDHGSLRAAPRLRPRRSAPFSFFWRRNPLALKRLSLFVTLVDEVLLDDPDLADADFHVLDFSAPDASSDRELRVISSRDVPRVSEDEKLAMLATFAEGYFLAQSHLSGAPSGKQPHDKREQPQSDPSQSDMFDPGGE